MALKLKFTSMMVEPEHWKKFRDLARRQGITASSLLRQVIAREVAQAARAARQDKVGE